MFERLLIANRGEIAVRIIRACRELGIETVAVYSEADAEALHVMLADRAVRLGPAQASASYLAIPRLIDAAHRTGAQAVHPGYGFLSENAAFAHACADAGLVFVGPPADAIERWARRSRPAAWPQRAGVPVVPGDTPGEQDDEAIAPPSSASACRCW
jgi:acetyl-CoA/propionyl-CoA carboxylase, biotin carboxylase, biotin carboxyl carrier protein